MTRITQTTIVYHGDKVDQTVLDLISDGFTVSGDKRPTDKEPGLITLFKMEIE